MAITRKQNVDSSTAVRFTISETCLIYCRLARRNWPSRTQRRQ